MQLHCPNCGQSIPAADINIALAIAKCAACDHVYNFAKDIGLPALRDANAIPAPIPPRFVIDDLGSELTIRWSWFTPSVWFLVLFCVFWDGFLIVWYSAVLFGAFATKGSAFMLLPAIFPLLHVAVGAGLTYFVAASFVNSTTVRVAYGELSAHHGPLPWWGNVKLNAADVSQLYCSERVNYGRRHTTTHYDVNAVLSDGTKQKVLSSLTEIEQALFLEQKLEEHLKIENQPVPGELRK